MLLLSISLFYDAAIPIATLFGCFNTEAKSSSWNASLGSHRVMRKYLFGARAMLNLCSGTRLESRLAPPLKHIFAAHPYEFYH